MVLVVAEHWPQCTDSVTSPSPPTCRLTFKPVPRTLAQKAYCCDTDQLDVDNGG